MIAVRKTSSSEVPAGNCRDLLLQHDAAVVDDHDLVTDLRNLGQDVRREHHRAIAGRHRLDQAADLVNLARVETDGRLVEHQHRRIVNQRLREADALSIALRELPANAMRHVLESAHVERMLERVFDLRARHSAQSRDETQIGIDAHIGIERRILRQVADLAARLERVFEDVETVDHDGARGRRHEAGDDAHGGGLAGAVGPEEAEDRAALGIERHVAYRDEVAVGFGQMPYFNHSVIDLDRHRAAPRRMVEHSALSIK